MAVRRGAVVLIWAFALQFVIGMVLTLFVTLPDQHPGANGLAKSHPGGGMLDAWP
jgi:hypothetical protein